tara:strand:+ start:2745 stop:3578 length:834 start_codon:yes stop_codon:yes gene_type:complete
MSICLHKRVLNVGIGGLGAIGAPVAKALIDGRLPGYRLVAVSANNRGSASDRLAQMGGTGIPVLALNELAAVSDVVIESVPAAHFYDIAQPTIEAGRVFIPMSVGALLEHPELIEQARQTGARIIVPSGALLGIDALNAAAEGEIQSVTLVTRKPPNAFVDTPYLEEQGIDVLNISDPLKVFEGNALDAASAFPASVNVSALLGIAGIGANRTSVEVWADPSLTRNTHQVSVTSDSSDFSFRIENIPSDQNPKTGLITAQSVIATLRRHASHFLIGT